MVLSYFNPGYGVVNLIAYWVNYGFWTILGCYNVKFGLLACMKFLVPKHCSFKHATLLEYKSPHS